MINQSAFIFGSLPTNEYVLKLTFIGKILIVKEIKRKGLQNTDRDLNKSRYWFHHDLFISFSLNYSINLSWIFQKMKVAVWKRWFHFWLLGILITNVEMFVKPK